MVGAHLADAFVAQRISVAVQLSMAQEAAEAAERTTPPAVSERERERAQLASERVPVVTQARGVCNGVCASVWVELRYV